MAYAVTVDVFGTYSHGKLAGKTNPKSFVTLTIFGDSVKQALGKINRESGGALTVVRGTHRLGEQRLDKVLPIAA